MLLHGSFGTRGPSLMQPWHPRRLQDRGERTPRPVFRTADGSPTPGVLPLGRVPGACGPLAATAPVVPASLLAKRTGNRPPADTGKTVQMGCQGVSLPQQTLSPQTPP